MLFGEIPVRDAQGAILAHALATRDGVIAKGTVLDAAHLSALAEAGYAVVMAARLEPGDVPEDEAARTAAQALAGPGLRIGPAFTGRCNLYAEEPGLVVYGLRRLKAVNAIHESLTVALLPPFAVAEAGGLVATVKVIPFAVPQGALDAWRALAAEALDGRLALAPFRPFTAGLVLTTLDSAKPSLIDKAAQAVRARIEALGGTLDHEVRVPHSVGTVAAALAAMSEQNCDLLLAFGATATVDRRDVIPAAITAAGGAVEHFGMPVDPGNLLLTGHLGGRMVVGVPGCARSPKLNGFDWVLQRLAARLPVRDSELASMGVGGLLNEMPDRPWSREKKPRGH